MNCGWFQTFKSIDKQTHQTPNTCRHSSEPGLRSMSLPSDLLTLCLSACAGWLYPSDKLPDEQLCVQKVQHLACWAHLVVKIDSEVEVSPWSPSTTTETSVNTEPSPIAWANTHADSKLLRRRTASTNFELFSSSHIIKANWRRLNKYT